MRRSGWPSHRPRAAATVVAVLASLAVLTGCGDNVAQTTAGGTAVSTTAPTPASASFEQIHRDNRRYAERLPFEGDQARLESSAATVRAALGPLAARGTQPTVDEVRQALAAALPDTPLSVLTNAVGLPGTAFGVGIDGGCVFGSILTELTVEVGGYVNDGGCVAIQAH